MDGPYATRSQGWRCGVYGMSKKLERYVPQGAMDGGATMFKIDTIPITVGAPRRLI